MCELTILFLFLCDEFIKQQIISEKVEDRIGFNKIQREELKNIDFLIKSCEQTSSNLNVFRHQPLVGVIKLPKLDHLFLSGGPKGVEILSGLNCTSLMLLAI